MFFLTVDPTSDDFGFGIMQWNLPVVGDFMSYQSPIGTPNEWGDHKANVMTIRNPVMIWDVPLATVVEE